MNTPTKITVSRIVMIVFMLISLFVLSFIDLNNGNALYLGNSNIYLVDFIVMILFVIGSFTDFLDGYLARKNNQVTDLGKFLDPIADKMLVDGILIYLLGSTINTPHSSITPVAIYWVIIMIIRDLIVDAISSFLADLMVFKHSSVISTFSTVDSARVTARQKAETAVFILSLAAFNAFTMSVLFLDAFSTFRTLSCKSLMACLRS